MKTKIKKPSIFMGSSTVFKAVFYAIILVSLIGLMIFAIMEEIGMLL
jgi:hypothetical protein